MTADIEPLFIKKNGEANPNWIQWYMATTNCDENKARYDWWVKVREMEEPPLMNASERPNPIWVTWWRAHKGCSNNVARNVCKAKIAGDYVPNKSTTRWLDRKKTTRMLEKL